MALKIYYDGDCYFCSNYVHLLQLRDVVGEVELVSLRETSDDVRRILDKGYNVNTGYVVEHEGKIYHGSDAFAYLNGLLDSRNWLNRVLHTVGKHRFIAFSLYPLLVVGRYLLLFLQGRPLIQSKVSREQTSQQETYTSRGFRLALLSVSIIFFMQAVKSVDNVATLFSVASGIVSAGLFTWTVVQERIAQKWGALLRDGSLLTLLVFAFIWFLLVNSGYNVFYRRLFGFIGAFPVIALFLSLYFEKRKEPNVGKICAAVPCALIVFVLFPGFIFPPFYGGIAGWTMDVDKSKPVIISGIRLVNDEQEEIWHNPAFLQPHTQVGRFQKAFLASGHKRDAYLAFLFENYKRIYPTLQIGRLPHQIYLGDFAYPTHNLQSNNSKEYVGAFHPDRITALKYQPALHMGSQIAFC